VEHLDKPAGVGHAISTIRAAINAVGRARWNAEPAHRYVAQERPADVRAILVGGHVIVLEEPSPAEYSDASRS